MSRFTSPRGIHGFTSSVRWSVVALTLAGSLLALANLSSARAAASARTRGQIIIPIHQTASTTQSPGGHTYAVTISLGSSPTDSGDVWVNCTQPSILNSPSGSWPYQLHWAANDPAEKNFSGTTNGVSQDTNVTVGACESDYDSTVQSNWQVTSIVTVHP